MIEGSVTVVSWPCIRGSCWGPYGHQSMSVNLSYTVLYLYRGKRDCTGFKHADLRVRRSGVSRKTLTGYLSSPKRCNLRPAHT